MCNWLILHILPPSSSDVICWQFLLFWDQNLSLQTIIYKPQLVQCQTIPGGVRVYSGEVGVETCAEYCQDLPHLAGLSNKEIITASTLHLINWYQLIFVVCLQYWHYYYEIELVHQFSETALFNDCWYISWLILSLLALQHLSNKR